MSSSIFVREFPIRFENCDPAGILFFPQYALMINRAVEDFFAEVLDCNFLELHEDRRLGIPTAHIELDMKKPCRLGDRIRWELTVDELRNTAVVLRHTGRGEDGVRLVAIQRMIHGAADNGWP